jgi:hypothetical protein
VAQVLAGFVATAVFTIGAIIVGYLTSSLPEHYLTDLDYAVVECLARSRVGIIFIRLWTAFIRISRSCLFLRPHEEGDRLTKRQRQKALKSFVLTLSDQQLVTGIAILLASLANWCRTSVYELNLVVSLAWFSSTTHLATLDVLQDYFWHNHVVRNWRIIGMVAIVSLLISGEIITGLYAGYNFVALLPCLIYLNNLGVYDCNGTLQFIKYANDTFDLDTGPYSANTSYNNCTWSVGNAVYMPANGASGIPLNLLASIFIVLYLAYSYTKAILGTFSLPPKDALTPIHLLVYVILKYITARKKRVPLMAINNAIVERDARERARISRRLAKLFKRNQSQTLQQLMLTIFAYRRSFLCQIGNLFFGLSYGLSQVVVSRWVGEPTLQDGSNRVDFGQIVPIVLLTLPLLAAAEIFHGMLLSFPFPRY